MVAPLAGVAVLPGRTRPTEPSAHIDTDGLAARPAASTGEMRQVVPPSDDQPAMMLLVPAADRAASTTVVRWPVVARPRTSTASCDRLAGRGGSAGRQPPADNTKMPATPGWPQRAATNGEPVAVHAAAVSACMSHVRAADEPARARSVVIVCHVAPAFVLALTSPV